MKRKLNAFQHFAEFYFCFSTQFTVDRLECLKPLVVLEARAEDPRQRTDTSTTAHTPPLHPLNFLQALQSGREVGGVQRKVGEIEKGGKDTERSRCPARRVCWLVGIGAGCRQVVRRAGHQHRAQLSPWESSSLHSTAPPPEAGSDIERMRTAAPYFAPVEKPMFCPQAGE